MIPQCLLLDEEQKKLVTRLVQEVRRIGNNRNEPDETCNLESEVHFTVKDRGVYTSIHVELDGTWLDLSRDDEGNLITAPDFVLDDDGEVIE